MNWCLGFVVVAASLLCGCTGRPTSSPLTRAAFDNAELIAYRTLTHDDFRAPMAMGFSVTEEQRIGATTCARIVMRPDDIVTRAERSAAGEVVYVSTLAEPIFFAVFGRKCSWWSAENTRAEDDLLEHEQIHFAISELEARRLNGRAEDIAQRARKSGTDLGSVRRRAVSEIHAILEKSNEALHVRNELFDTQVFPADRVRQRQWFLKIVAELEATKILARGPQTSALSEDALVLAAPPATPPTPVTPILSPAPVPEPPAKLVPSAPPVPETRPPAPPPPSSPGSTVSFPD